MLRRNKDKKNKERSGGLRLLGRHKRQNSFGASNSPGQPIISTENSSDSALSIGPDSDLKALDYSKTLQSQFSKSSSNIELPSFDILPSQVPITLTSTERLSTSKSSGSLANSNSDGSSSMFASNTTTASSSANSFPNISLHRRLSLSGKSVQESTSTEEKKREREKLVNSTLNPGIFGTSSVIDTSTAGLNGKIEFKLKDAPSVIEASKVYVTDNHTSPSTSPTNQDNDKLSPSQNNSHRRRDESNNPTERENSTDPKIKVPEPPTFFGQVKVELDLTPEEIAILKKTWNYILNDDSDDPDEKRHLPIGGHGYASGPSRSAVGSTLFFRQMYANLISIAPGIENLFPSILHQSVAFGGVITAALSNIDKIYILDDYLGSLGRRHARVLGIEPFQYELLGTSLVRTLEERFEDDFTEEAEESWLKLYNYLCNKLLQEGIDPHINRGGQVGADLETVHDRHVSVAPSIVSNSTGRTVSTHKGPSNSLMPMNPHSSLDKYGHQIPRQRVSTYNKKAYHRPPPGSIASRMKTSQIIRGNDATALQNAFTDLSPTGAPSILSSNSNGSKRTGSATDKQYMQGDVDFQDCLIS